MSKQSAEKRIANSVKHSEHMSQLIKLYFSEKSGKESSDMLNDKSFYVNQEPITYRQLNHWEENGILPERDGTKWRKFGLMEALWVHIIAELRTAFEVRLDGIKNIMDCLTEGPNKYNVFMPIFEIFVMEALARKRRVYLIIFEDKSAAPVDEESLTGLIKKELPGHVLILDINKILKKLIPKYEWALK